MPYSAIHRCRHRIGLLRLARQESGCRRIFIATAALDLSTDADDLMVNTELSVHGVMTPAQIALTPQRAVTPNER